MVEGRNGRISYFGEALAIPIDSFLFSVSNLSEKRLWFLTYLAKYLWKGRYGITIEAMQW